MADRPLIDWQAERARPSYTVPAPLFGRPIGPWRPAFAWLPVRLFDGHRIWLRPYVRRGVQKLQCLDGGADFWWQNADRAVCASEGGALDAAYRRLSRAFRAVALVAVAAVGLLLWRM